MRIGEDGSRCEDGVQNDESESESESEGSGSGRTRHGLVSNVEQMADGDG